MSNSNSARQKTLFMDNLYRLDTEAQHLQIFDSEGSHNEVTEEIFLTDRVSAVVTDLGTELRDDSEELSNGIVSKRIVDLPSGQGGSPFAVHLKEGSLMIFWSASASERATWIRAFQSLATCDDGGRSSGTSFWIELSRSNFFSVTLYRCLMPQLRTKVAADPA